MEDDWESEDFIPPPPGVAREALKSQWDDEDGTEEEDVKESWEDEDQPKPVAAPVPALASASTAVSAVAATTVTQKGKAEKKKLIENKEKKAVVEDDPATKLAEKLRQQRLVEEADYQSTTELFGKNAIEKTLDTFIPKSESDFLEYAELIGDKLSPFQKSFHYLTMVKAIIRHAMGPLRAADAKEIASTVQTISNQKLKTEKEATVGKKKTAPKKKQLLVEADENNYAGAYDDVDDYDFM